MSANQEIQLPTILDEEMEIVETTASLCSRPNQLAYIHRLPNEILAFIFELGLCSGVRALHKYLAISRAWRQLAFHTPRLWKDLCMLPPALIATYLDQTEHGLLDVRVQDERRLFEYLDPLSPHISRWKTCDIKVLAGCSYPRLFLPAPNLKALHLATRSEYACDWSPSVLSLRLFAGVTAELSDLALTAVFILFTHHIYTHLTKLRLHCLRFSLIHSIKGLFAVLETSSSLENLGLYCLTFELTAEKPDDVLPFVSLPHLRALGVEQNIDKPQMRSILSHLIIPTSSHLSFISHLGPPEDLRTILPRPSHTHPNLQMLSCIHQLAIRAEWPPYAAQDKCVLTGQASESNGDGFTIDLRVTWGSIVGMFSGIFSSLGEAFPMPHLDSLILHECYGNLHYALLADFLTRHPSINKITFAYCRESLIYFLITTNTGFCPRLRILAFTDCHLDEDRLMEFVKSRAEARYDSQSVAAAIPPLRHLAITNCPGITESTVAKLECYLNVQYLVTTHVHNALCHY
ncbi:hypothetical protein BOTBODRAFT_541253 [Botryobasidium botryosum FD-172 SS1]|uniref:F-box domain-containing protein n=1 Tax=Botryobasidium botryosum (strain FD-172 SS1) TaxID=930990 RepID=A0A067N139_BOTB1|nr:hypothetical protein BOTBODRAFT_541253 [Botryobasidium botryosum FD-172 SS1]